MFRRLAERTWTALPRFDSDGGPPVRRRTGHELRAAELMAQALRPTTRLLSHLSGPGASGHTDSERYGKSQELPGSPARSHCGFAPSQCAPPTCPCMIPTEMRSENVMKKRARRKLTSFLPSISLKEAATYKLGQISAYWYANPQ